VRAAARKLLQDRSLTLDKWDRNLLTAVVEGKRKQLDADWWRDKHKVVEQGKLDKLARMADPKLNPNAHERAVAADKLKAFKFRNRVPGLPPDAFRMPLPDFVMPNYGRSRPESRQPSPPPKPKHGGVKHGGVKHGGVKHGGAKQKKAPESDGGGVKQKPKRPGDRHRDPNKDRHRPGYMRDYMKDYQRRRRAKAT